MKKIKTSGIEEIRTKQKDKKIAIKKNPDSLISTLKMIREKILGETQEKFASRIAARPQRLHRSITTRKDILAIENNQVSITYAHLELYANCIGVPAGIILLFSRLFANQRDLRNSGQLSRAGNKISADSRKLINDFVFILNSISDSTEFDSEELARWRQIIDDQTAFSGTIFSQA